MATIAQIAKKAGVGVTTVSRYLNNHPYISQDKKDKIKRAIDELGYTPNSIAIQLRSKTTQKIGVLVSRISNPFFAELFDQIERELHQYNYQVVVMQTYDDSSVEANFLSQIENGQFDGALLGSVENVESVQRIAEKDPQKIVMVNNTIDVNDVKEVTLDHYAATMQGLNYLKKQGRQSIAYVTGGKLINSSHGLQRSQAYLDFLNENNISKDKMFIFEHMHTIGDGQSIANQLINSENLPDAIFSNSDEVAIGIIDGLVKSGLEVPNDIAVMGYDDQPMAKFNQVPLTTIQQPIGNMAHLAVQQLLFNLKVIEEIEYPMLDLKLIIRQSA